MYIAHIDELDSGLNERVIEGHKFFIYKDGNDIKIYDFSMSASRSNTSL